MKKRKQKTDKRLATKKEMKKILVALTGILLIFIQQLKDFKQKLIQNILKIDYLDMF